jgi:hypothetical protein
MAEMDKFYYDGDIKGPRVGCGFNGEWLES